MSRFSPSVVPTLLVVVCLPLGMLAAVEPSQQGQPEAGAGDDRPEIAGALLPGFLELPAEDVQEELELTDEQRQKLSAIGQEFYEQTRRDWAESRGITTEERKEEQDQARRQWISEIRRQVEQVLTPDQLGRLKQINLRIRGVAALADPEVLDELEMTETQRQMLNHIRDQMEEKTRRLRQETSEKTLDVLTPEQRKRLEELIAGGVET